MPQNGLLELCTCIYFELLLSFTQLDDIDAVTRFDIYAILRMIIVASAILGVRYISPVRLRDGRGEGNLTMTIVSDDMIGLLIVYQSPIKVLQTTQTKILSH